MRKYLLCIGLFLCSLPLSAQNSNTHTVQSGETITSICEQYGISREEFTRLNPSVRNYVYTGQVLNIPDVKQEKTDAADRQPEEIPVIKETPKVEVKNTTSKQRSGVKVNKYDSENLFIPGSDLMIFGNEYLGLYCKPEKSDAHYIGLSAGIGPAFRKNLTDLIFVQGAIDMGLEDRFTYYKKTVSVLDDDMTTIVRTNDYCGNISFPVHFGLDFDQVAIRAGVFGRLAWIGYNSSNTKQTYKGETQKNSTFVEYKEIEGLKRFVYGLSFDVTLKTVYNREKGLGFRFEKTKDSNNSLKLIYFVCYIYPD